MEAHLLPYLETAFTPKKKKVQNPIGKNVPGDLREVRFFTPKQKNLKRGRGGQTLNRETQASKNKPHQKKGITMETTREDCPPNPLPVV